MVKLSNKFFRNSETRISVFFGFPEFLRIFEIFGNFFGIVSKFPVDMACVVVAYSLTSTDVDREVFGSTLTKVSRNLYKLENMEKGFVQGLLRFTRTCMTHITFFDVKFEHSNLQTPFCELLSHTTSLYLMIFVTGSYKNDDQESCVHSKADVYRRCHAPISG